MDDGSVLRVLITGAAGRIGYSLVQMMCLGHAFGSKQKLSITLFDLPKCEKVMQGILMEIKDCAYSLVSHVKISVDEEEAFKNIDVVVFLGSFPRGPGMERADMLKKNMEIFSQQGKLLEKAGNRNIKVLVVGNPANTNTLILANGAPSIPKQNFSCLMRLDHNRTLSMVGEKLNVPLDTVSNVVVWGNHSNTQCPCIDYVQVTQNANAQAMLNEDEMQKWASESLTHKVRGRGAEIITHLGASSALSAAKATCDHLRDWYLGTPEGTFVTMGVVSDGSYDVPSGLVFGFPVKCHGHFQYEIVKNLPLSGSLCTQIQESVKELKNEECMAMH